MKEDLIFNTYFKMCKGNYLRTSKLLAIHKQKEHERFMRDLCDGKAVSLHHPRRQDLETFEIIKRYARIYDIVEKLDSTPYKY